jgi:hypothetical protein
MDFDEEEVPKGKQHMIKVLNSVYKWQDGPNVIGALEVHSEPDFKPRDHLQRGVFLGREDAF